MLETTTKGDYLTYFALHRFSLNSLFKDLAVHCHMKDTFYLKSVVVLLFRSPYERRHLDCQGLAEISEGHLVQN